MTITFVAESKPSISVRIWLSVCSRSSLPPLKPAEPLVRERPTASSSSMKMIDGALSFASLNRSRTRDAPTPTIASTNSDAAIEKNGSVRLAGDRAREQRLPGAGRAGEKHAVRDPAAQLAVLVRVAEEVDDLAQLLLRLVDSGDVGEGDLVARRLVAAGTRSSERAEDVLHVARPAEQPEQEEDEEDRRPEAEQQRLPPRRAPFERLGVDRDVVLLEQLGELVRVGEGGDLGRNRVVGFELLEGRPPS